MIRKNFKRRSGSIKHKKFKAWPQKEEIEFWKGVIMGAGAIILWTTILILFFPYILKGC